MNKPVCAFEKSTSEQSNEGCKQRETPLILLILYSNDATENHTFYSDQGNNDLLTDRSLEKNMYVG